MGKPSFQFQVRGNYIGGEFQAPVDPNGEWEVLAPGNLKDSVGVFKYGYEDVDAAVQTAREAFFEWRAQRLEARAELLKRYQAVLKKREPELVEAIAREVGKPLWEAKTEVAAMVNKIDVTLNESMKLVAEMRIPKLMDATDGVVKYHAHGVMAVIGPFNFPGHLPNGHIVPALATGNVVVFKPSEKTPMVGQLMAECFDEAGFPPGVFNLVQGEKEVGRRLCVSEGVDGILFTGSYEVGLRIKQDTLQQHWKILALEMGGKNAVIVWEDASFEAALREVFLGAFLTTGQRCSATSRAIVHRKVFDRFVERFHHHAKNFQIGDPLDNPFMGPLIESASVDRYMKFLGIAQREGCEVVMRGKPLQLETPGHFVAPSICTAKGLSVEASQKSVYQQTELFAPNILFLDTDDLDEAIAQVNCTPYGLVSAVFTQSRDVFERCAQKIEAGLINWNRSTVGASSRLPFGGLKKSGNHFPTALSAPLYCAYPVASMETEKPDTAAPTNPGLHWDK